jgi:hypothetical protein
MPVIIAALIGGLVSASASFVGRALIALGVGVVVYTGVDIALGEFKTIFITSANGMDGRIVGMLGIFKIGTGLNIVISSILARLALNGLTSGSMKRFVLK